MLNLRIARRKEQFVHVESQSDSEKSSEALVQTVDRDDFPYIEEELSRVKLLKMVWRVKRDCQYKNLIKEWGKYTHKISLIRTKRLLGKKKNFPNSLL